MATAQEKLVVRVSLGAASAASTDLPEPITEQHWHWRRIAGAVFTLCAAALLLYGWLNVDSPDSVAAPVAGTAPLVMTSESVETATPELVLEAVAQNPEPQAIEMASNATPEPDIVEPDEVAVLTKATEPKAPEEAEPASVSTEAGAPLFMAKTGVLRLALLTNETPSAQAHSLGDQIEAAAVPQLTLYSEVKGLNGQTIEHRWYYEGKLMTSVKLPVKLDYWRTYSRKEFDPIQKGEWRVEILDPQQNLLFSHHFHYH